MPSFWQLAIAPALCAAIYVRPDATKAARAKTPLSRPEPGERPGASERRAAGGRDAQGLANPAGCANVASTERDLEKLKGVFPVEDFRDLLGSETANRTGGPEKCQDAVKAVKWCPAPKQPPYLGRDSTLTGEVEHHLLRELEGTDASRPLAVAVLQIDVQDLTRTSFRGLQIFNFLCGWERLGILENRSAIFVTNEELAAELRRWSPKARVLYHKGIDSITRQIQQRTILSFPGRALKMAVAQLLLNLGRDVILSDMDVYWVRDPTPVFQKAALKDGVEFAAMKDMCWLELNSGFLYYRNTPSTRRMLEVALTTLRDASLGGCADNDQYLINCGFARAVLEDKLNYRILPPSGFGFGSQGNIGGRSVCHSGQADPNFAVSWLGDGLPYIWHTAGFTTPYNREVDMFAAFGLIDLDRDTGRCLAGPRGQPTHAKALARSSSRSCSTDPGGFSHAHCFGDCATPSVQAESLLSSFSKAYQSWRRSAGDD